ncbi:MAG: radical SAM protein [Brumimicrobium sp.]|nr:radical SAM protein [Brumimicrobium sp.]
MYIDGAIIKIASRCNLNCKYCYIYNKGDETYLNQPKFMSEDVIRSFAKKLRNYLQHYNKNKFIIVFHGGEPMLAGKDRIQFFINEVKRVNKGVVIHFAMQTNGTLIDESWQVFFQKNKINVGISIDGTKESNDFYRVKKNGKTSYKEIKRGLEMMQKVQKQTGVLSVIDVNQKAEDVYNHYHELKIRNANLLFPDDNYDDNYNDDLTLGRWLVKMYDLWFDDENENKVKIEQFVKLNALILGYEVNDEYYGIGRPNTFVLETDGEYQINDPIRVCYNKMSKTKLSVFKNEIEEIYELPLAFMYYNNHKLLCEKCNACELKRICGGGYVINRYSKRTGFDNPTIYCKSIAFFISHVQNRLMNYLGNEIVSSMNIELLNYDNIESFVAKDNKVKNAFLGSFNKKN